MQPASVFRGGIPLAAVMALACGPATADWALNMPRGVTPLAHEAYDLHMLIMWICVIIGIIVFGAMFWSIWQHRKAAGYEAAQFHHSTFAEIFWTVIPVLILIGMAWPATNTLIRMEDTSDADLTLKVTGYQWKWKYEYLEDDVLVYSNLASASRAAIFGDNQAEVPNYLLDVDNPIVVPANKKVNLLLTSDDVIHAWWVPDLGMKKDAVPGFVNQLWFKIEKEGTYRGQCAELCGKDHGFMPIVVKAVSDAEYVTWVKAQKQAKLDARDSAKTPWSKQDLMAKGETVYTASCAGCHQINGEGVPSAFPPIKGSAVVTGDVAQHLKVVLEGRSGTAMKPFSDQLSDVEMAAVITYQRNAFGNDIGDLLQPADVTAAREL